MYVAFWHDSVFHPVGLTFFLDHVRIFAENKTDWVTIGNVFTTMVKGYQCKRENRCYRGCIGSCRLFTYRSLRYMFNLTFQLGERKLLEEHSKCSKIERNKHNSIMFRFHLKKKCFSNHFFLPQNPFERTYWLTSKCSLVTFSIWWIKNYMYFVESKSIFCLPRKYILNCTNRVTQQSNITTYAVISFKTLPTKILFVPVFTIYVLYFFNIICLFWLRNIHWTVSI